MPNINAPFILKSIIRVPVGQQARADYALVTLLRIKLDMLTW